MQTREEMFRHILVPQGFHFTVPAALGLPLIYKCAVDHIYGFDKEGSRSGGWIEDLDEVLVQGNSVGDGDPSIRHLSPGSSVCEAILQPKLRAK